MSRSLFIAAVICSLLMFRTKVPCAIERKLLTDFCQSFIIRRAFATFSITGQRRAVKKTSKEQLMTQKDAHNRDIDNSVRYAKRSSSKDNEFRRGISLCLASPITAPYRDNHSAQVTIALITEKQKMCSI